MEIENKTRVKDLFVSYDISKQLKEKGFDYPCLGVYLNDEKFYQNYEVTPRVLGTDKYTTCLAPLYQQMIEWFWEKHRFRITQQHQDITGMWFSHVYKWDGEKWLKLTMVSSHQYLNDALDASIEVALKEI